MRYPTMQKLNSLPVAYSKSIFVASLISCVAAAAVGLTGCSGCSPTEDQQQEGENKRVLPTSSVRQPNLFEKKDEKGYSNYPRSLDPYAKPIPPGDWVTTPSGLKYQDLEEGWGMSPTRGYSVMVHYNGYLSDGSRFESSRDKGMPFKFVVGDGRVIKGFEEAIMNMKVGGKRKAIIPPQLAYGSEAHGKIPAGETLTYEIQLVSADK